MVLLLSCHSDLEVTSTRILLPTIPPIGPKEDRYNPTTLRPDVCNEGPGVVSDTPSLKCGFLGPYLRTPRIG